MTGYQEILTDPSYAGQIITFTFPHIGNVGVNDEDIETVNMAAASGVRGCVLKTDITEPSNYRATRHFDAVAEGARHHRHRRRRHARADRPHPRQGHAERGHRPRRGRRLRPRRGCSRRRRPGRASSAWTSPRRSPPARPTPGTRPRGSGARATAGWTAPKHHVVAVDYGIKRNILRLLADHGCRVTVLPATATGGGNPRPQAGRRVPLERPRRPGGDRRICRAGDQGR